MDDRADGGARRVQPRHERRHRRTVSDVTDGVLEARPRLGEFRGEFGGTGHVRAASAGQHQVLGSRGGQPAGDVRSDRARGAGDQDGSPRVPGPSGRPAVLRGTGEAAHQGGAAANHPLILVAAAREHVAELGGGPLVVVGGQVDQAAPELRVLQADDTAEPPHRRLRGVPQVPLAGRGGGAPGQAPQRGGPTRVVQRLGEHGGERQARGQARVLRVRQFGQGQQRQHALRPCPVGEGRGQFLAAGAGGDGVLLDPGAAFGERAECADHPGVLAVSLRDDRQPGAGQRPCLGRGRAPGDPVAPGVRGDLRGRRRQPVPLALEGIGGQGHQPAARVERGRVHVHAVRPGGAE